MRSIAIRAMVMAATVSGAVACGRVQPEEDGSAVVRDEELASMRQQLIPPPTTPDQAATGKSFYVRLSWGALTGASHASADDWSGSLSTDQGTVQLTHVMYEDPGAPMETQPGLSRIDWRSNPGTQVDGLVARVEVPSDDATITFETPSFTRSFRAGELTGGDDAVFPIDTKHAVSLSSVPASRCKGGFVVGYIRASPLGWLAFGGLSTDRTGRYNGRIRFRSFEDGSVKGRVVDESGRASVVQGTLVQDPSGGSYSAELLTDEGRAVGSLTGIYTGPASGSRGSFQGTYEQVCE